MSTNFHVPIAPGASNAASTWNTRFASLDSAIDIQTGSVQDALDALIIESGTSDAETIAARTSINYLVGSPPATLGAALELAAAGLFNVLAYGAVANGSTDDTTAIQEAIDAAAANGGGRVWIPRQGSKYKIAGTLELESNVWLMSDGATLDTDGNTNAAIIFAVGKIDMRISGLRIEGTGTNGIGSGVVPISMDGCSRVWIDQNDINQTPTEDDVNTVAIRISDDPAATTDATNDYSDIWIVNNVIRPTSLGILAQSRLSNDCEMSRLYILGNTIDYANIDADTQVVDFPAAIKVDLNVRESVIANNMLYGRGFCRDGINVQEDLHDVVITGNIVRGFDNYGIAVDGGQTIAEVRDVIVSNNIVTGMIGAASRAISVSCSTATTWRNVSVLGNTIHSCAGFGIYENGEGNRVENYVVVGNTVSECTGVSIYVRSHRAMIHNNAVKTAAAAACISIVGTALNCSIVGNRLDSATTAVSDNGSGTIIRNNVIDDLWAPGIENVTITNRWASTDGEYWIIEGVLTGLAIAANVTTTIDLTLDVMPYGSTTRGGYICTGEVTAGSSSSNVIAGHFVAWMRMTDAATVSSQGGQFTAASSATVLNDISLDTDLTSFQLKIVNTNATESADNVMIKFRLSKSATL